MSFYQKLTFHFNNLKSLAPSPRFIQKRPYIVPTKFGLYFAITVLFMIGIGFNYSNNLVYLVAFFLASIGLVAMHMTNYNLQILNIKFSSQKTLHAGEENLIGFTADIIEKKISYEIEFNFDMQKEKKIFHELKNQNELQLSLNLPKRGWVNLPALNFQSQFPFGLLRSWKRIKFENSVLVYPQRKGQTQIPKYYHLTDEIESDNDIKNSFANKYKNEDFLFAGHRNFQNYDSYKRVDWKAYARTQSLLVKEFETENIDQEIEIHYKKTNAKHNIEERISQLALWIDLSEKTNKKYSLILPQIHYTTKNGVKHYHECMKALAELSSL